MTLTIYLLARGTIFRLSQEIKLSSGVGWYDNHLSILSLMKYISRLTLWQIIAHLKSQACVRVRLPSLSLNRYCIILRGNHGSIRP